MSISEDGEKMTKMDDVRSKLPAETSLDSLLAFCKNVSDAEIRHRILRAYMAEAELHATNCMSTMYEAIDRLMDNFDNIKRLHILSTDGIRYIANMSLVISARDALDEAVEAEEEYQRIKRIVLAEVDDDEAD
jgi:hypothetical protein